VDNIYLDLRMNKSGFIMPSPVADFSGLTPTGFVLWSRHQIDRPMGPVVKIDVLISVKN
jgi:hypothetical protein